MSLLKSFAVNERGRDFAIGDIHGHFTRLQEALDASGFNPEVDRLFSVGDLVDRGPESHLALEWLQKPFFHAIRGNHEEMAIMHANGGINKEVYLSNGGSWFMAMTLHQQLEFAHAFADLPLAIEIETPAGTVGLVHADCPFPNWEQLRDSLSGPLVDCSIAGRALLDCIQWSRERIRNNDHRGVSGIRAVVAGHTSLQRPARLGNVVFIDTAGWKSGYFTLLNLHTFGAHVPEIAHGEEA